MKQILKIFLGVSFLLFLITGCEKESELTVLKHISFPSAVTMSSNDIVITENNLSNEILTVTWPAVDYTIDAAVTYLLQIDVPSDTSGITGWGNAKNTKVGVDILSKTFKGSDLNKLVISLGLETNVAGKIVIRVRSEVDRYAYSGAVTLNVTPYEKVVVEANDFTLWVPGDFQSWNFAKASKLILRNPNTAFEGYIYIPAGGNNQYKLTAQAAWEPTTYGDGGNGTVIKTNSSGASFTAPSDGYFMLTANLNTMKYTITKTTWSILGSATPGGWTTDTQLKYNPTTQTWSVTADMLADGTFKFRANNAWVIDFAVDSEGIMKYADHPVFGYTAGLNDLTVPSSGNYTITLDLHDASNYTYELKKN
jgi:starch-binding outer membrane protein SusE/F